jgi:uncharacterized ferritin-like protein (DUF455 family)
MPEKNASDFAGLFDKRLDVMPPAAERNEAKAAPEPEPVVILPVRVGKRSNPAYKQYSVLLKKKTHMEVSHALDRAGRAQDVSDLVQQLMEQWLKRAK